MHLDGHIIFNVVMGIATYKVLIGLMGRKILKSMKSEEKEQIKKSFRDKLDDAMKDKKGDN